MTLAVDVAYAGFAEGFVLATGVLPRGEPAGLFVPLEAPLPVGARLGLDVGGRRHLVTVTHVEETGETGVRVAAIDGHLLRLHDLFPGQVAADPVAVPVAAAASSASAAPALEPPSDDAVPRVFVPEAIDIDLKGISSPVPVAQQVERSARIVAPMTHAVTLPGPPPSAPPPRSARRTVETESGMPVAAAGESDSGPTRRDSPVAVPKVMLDAEPTMLLPGGSSATATVAALAAAGKVTTSIPVPTSEDGSGELNADGKRGGRPRRRGRGR